MSIFTIFSNYNNKKILFNILKQQQRINPVFSETGAIISGKIPKTYIKDNYSLNSSVASKDIMINNHYSTIYNISVSNYNNLPIINQGPNECCQLIPFIHAIQNQLNFPIDYEKFINCIPTKPSNNIPKNLLNNLQLDTTYQVDRNYIKLFNLLYSGACFEVSSSKESLCQDVQTFGSLSDECLHCGDVRGIKITVINSIQNNNDDDCCNSIKNGNIRALSISGLPAVKLLLWNNYSNIFPSWEYINNLTTQEIIDLINNSDMDDKDKNIFIGNDGLLYLPGVAHMLTVIDCNGQNENGEYELSIKNSMSPHTDFFTIKYGSICDIFKNSIDEFGIYNYIIKINPCDPSSGLTDDCEICDPTTTTTPPTQPPIQDIPN